MMRGADAEAGSIFLRNYYHFYTHIHSLNLNGEHVSMRRQINE